MVTIISDKNVSAENGILKVLIEDSLPIKDLGYLSTKEKPANKKTLSSLHQWWARRPLSLSRAIIAACLLKSPMNASERHKLHALLVKTCSLEAGYYNNIHIIQELQQELLKTVDLNGINFLDPFGGGGSIPFEARRLGLNVFTGDLNPVSYLIRQAALELIPKFKNYSLIKESQLLQSNYQLSIKTNAPLIKDTYYWGLRIRDAVHAELKEFFEEDTMLYFWLKTCRCLTCGQEIPLKSIKWLSLDKKITINLVPNKENNSFKVTVLRSETHSPVYRDRTGAICIFCKSKTLSSKDIREQAKKQGLGSIPMAKMIINRNKTANKWTNERIFTEMTNEDVIRAKEAAENYLQQKMLKNAEFVPTEPAPKKGSLGNSAILYGYDSFDKFYSSRQKLVLGCFTEQIRNLLPNLLAEGYQLEHAKTIILLLAFTLDRLAMFNNQFTFWYQKGELIKSGLTVGQYRISWEYIEPNPFSWGTGSWESALKTTLAGVAAAAINVYPRVYADRIGSATNLPYSNEFIDLIVTDPPYYDYIGYSTASDFFYVWLKRTVGKLFPEAFKTPLTPKSEELILTNKSEEAKRNLEEGLQKTWKECYRVLKKSGLLVIQFTHQSIEAWEKLFESIHAAGFYPTATWPVLSESPSKLSAHRADIKTTLLIICRKASLEIKIGDFQEIKVDLKAKIWKKCQELREINLFAADFFVATMGPAIEVFAQFKKILTKSDEPIKIKTLIQLAREYVCEYVLEVIMDIPLEGAFDQRTRLYLLWRWFYGFSAISVIELYVFLHGLGLSKDQLLKEARIKLLKRNNNIWATLIDPIEKFSRLSLADSKLWGMLIFEPLIDQIQVAGLLKTYYSIDLAEKYLEKINVLNNSLHIFWKVCKAFYGILVRFQKTPNGSEAMNIQASEEINLYKSLLSWEKKA